MVDLASMLYSFSVMSSLVVFSSDVGVTTATAAVSPQAPRSPRMAWIHRSRASGLTRAPLAVRGGSAGTNDDTEDEAENDEARSRDYRSFMQQVPPPYGGGIDSDNSDNSRQENKPAERIEKIAADLKARRDDIAADVRARGEAIAADLKAKQAKIADEVLRDRSPEAFGELGGHRSYDSATAVRFRNHETCPSVWMLFEVEIQNWRCCNDPVPSRAPLPSPRLPLARKSLETSLETSFLVLYLLLPVSLVSSSPHPALRAWSCENLACSVPTSYGCEVYGLKTMT